MTHTTWSTLNKASAQTEIDRMQRKILLAYQQGMTKKVLSLQRVLMQSLSARILAVLHVTDYSIGRVPGVDGLVWITDQQKVDAVHALKDAVLSTYKAGPTVVRLLKTITYGALGLKTPVGIPTCHDRGIQYLLYLALQPIATSQSCVSPSSTWRTPTAVLGQLQRLILGLKGRDQPRGLLSLSIRGLFTSVGVSWLTKNIPLPVHVLQQLAQTGQLKFIQNMENLALQQHCIDQPLQHLLLALFFNGLEKAIIDGLTLLRAKPTVYVLRYGSELLVAGPAMPVFIYQAYIWPSLRKFLTIRGVTQNLSTYADIMTTTFTWLELTVSLVTLSTPSKSKATQLKLSKPKVAGPLSGMGKSWANAGILFRPSNQAVMAVLAVIRDILKANRHLPLVQLLEVLNPVLVLWAAAYRDFHSSQAMRKLDRIVWGMLLSWLRVKYPERSVTWLFRNFYETVGRTRLPVGHIKGVGERIVKVPLYGMATVRTRGYVQSKRTK